MSTKLVIAFLLVHIKCGLVPDEISVLILSQKNKYHLRAAEHLKDVIVEQSRRIDVSSAGPKVHLSHKTLRSNAWVITPVLIDILNKLIKPQTIWLVLCEANTMVNEKKLLKKLNGEDDSEELFLGFRLVDRAATIIHNFAFHNNPTSFRYQFICAGVAFSLPLLHRMIDATQIPLSSSPSKLQLHIEISIDASHELALFLWNVDKRLKLKTVPYFCSQPSSSE